MGKIYYTREELENLTVGDLRNVSVGLGGTPANKPKATLINEILAILNGELVPVRNRRGRPSLRAARVMSEVSVRDIGSLPDVCEGMLEPTTSGYGYIRPKNYEYSNKDAFISLATIKKFGLHEGDMVYGELAYRRENRMPEMIEVKRVNGEQPRSKKRPKFETLTAYYPKKKYEVGTGGDVALRTIDMFCPIGKGTRGIMIAPTDSGEAVLIKKMVRALERNYPDLKIFVLFIGMYPEEITDFKEGLNSEIVASTFDRDSKYHTHVAEMCFNRAKSLAEEGNDVMVILDSVTKLVRAYDDTLGTANGTINDVVGVAAVEATRKLLGYAKNTDSGTYTVVATVDTETGSHKDELILDQFENMGNTKIVLADRMADMNVYPAIDVSKSFTKKDEYLLDGVEKYVTDIIHKMLMKKTTNTKNVLSYMSESINNEIFCANFSAEELEQKND